MTTPENSIKDRGFFAAVIGLAILAALSFGYFIFCSRFAEVHFQPSFLDFPVFIGEATLFVCAAIFALGGHYRTLGRSWHVFGLMSLLVWILLKTAWGYQHGGPLAFRNAALFYYGFSAALSYGFVRQMKSCGSLFASALAVFSVGYFFESGFGIALSFCILGAAVLSVKDLWRRGMLLVLLVIFVLTSGLFHNGVRAHMLGVLCMGIFLTGYAVMFFASRRTLLNMMVVCIVFVVLAGVFLRMSDRNALVSLARPVRLVAGYREYRAMLNALAPNYKPMTLNVCLYHDNLNGPHDGSSCYKTLPEESYRQSLEADIATSPSVQPDYILPEILARQKQLEGETDSWSSTDASGRNLQVAYNNAIFRIFIWQDMLEELRKEKPVFGFSFGKPQRSRSLEILGWGRSEWERDGYITPHNSFLNIIYRGGIVGLAMIVAVFLTVFAMARDFLFARSWLGGFLVGSLVYGLVSSMFMLFLELPYTAIPFWTVFGATLAYAHRLKTHA